MSQVKERVTKITRRPAVAHLIRGYQRFSERLGNQFGAAITYFSVLAIVPIIMFGFSILGFVLVKGAPQLMDPALQRISSAMASLDTSTRAALLRLITNSLQHYAAIGIIGLLSALYSGAGWVGNLKDAVRAQWRPSFDVQVKKENFLVKNLSNIAILIGLLIMLVTTFALASVSTSLSGAILGWVGLSRIGWLRPVLQFVPVVFSVGAGWLVFMYLYLVLPETRERWAVVRRGSLIGAIGLGILQYLTSFLIGRFAQNQTASLFGPVIALMLFLNLFARLVLFVAAWIGTADHPVEPEEATAAQQAAQAIPAGQDADRTKEGPVTQAGAGAAAPGGAAHISGAGRPVDSDRREPWSSTPGLVPEQVAVRSVRVGARAGYLTGTATGAGAGAVVALLLERRKARRERRRLRSGR